MPTHNAGCVARAGRLCEMSADSGEWDGGPRMAPKHTRPKEDKGTASKHAVSTKLPPCPVHTTHTLDWWEGKPVPRGNSICMPCVVRHAQPKQQHRNAAAHVVVQDGWHSVQQAHALIDRQRAIHWHGQREPPKQSHRHNFVAQHAQHAACGRAKGLTMHTRLLLPPTPLQK